MLAVLDLSLGISSAESRTKVLHVTNLYRDISMDDASVELLIQCEEEEISDDAANVLRIYMRVQCEVD
jgi:hypothetical protein